MIMFERHLAHSKQRRCLPLFASSLTAWKSTPFLPEGHSQEDKRLLCPMRSLRPNKATHTKPFLIILSYPLISQRVKITEEIFTSEGSKEFPLKKQFAS